MGTELTPWGSGQRSECGSVRSKCHRRRRRCWHPPCAGWPPARDTRRTQRRRLGEPASWCVQWCPENSGVRKCRPGFWLLHNPPLAPIGSTPGTVRKSATKGRIRRIVELLVPIQSNECVFIWACWFPYALGVPLAQCTGFPVNREAWFYDFFHYSIQTHTLTTQTHTYTVNEPGICWKVHGWKFLWTSFEFIASFLSRMK